MTTQNDHDSTRYRWLGRMLEMVPGTISWAVLILPLWLSFSYPWLVAYFVLSFDFYWLCRALWFSAAVIVAYGRIRRVLASDWTQRLENVVLASATVAHVRAHDVPEGAEPMAGAWGVSLTDRNGETVSRRAKHDLKSGGKK